MPASFCVNPRPALTPSARNRVGVGPRAARIPATSETVEFDYTPTPPSRSPQNHAAAAAIVKFTERTAREGGCSLQHLYAMIVDLAHDDAPLAVDQNA
jgi:hypothetical protein